MNKVNKTFTIDFSLAKKLEKEKNASELICKLLKKHYEQNNE